MNDIFECPTCGHEGIAEEFKPQLDVTDFVESSDNWDGEDLPCYMVFIRRVDNLPDNVEVGFFLEMLVDEFYDYPLIQFSVTSKEPRYQEFLDALEGYPGVAIIPVKRGEYTCYLCSVPREPVL